VVQLFSLGHFRVFLILPKLVWLAVIFAGSDFDE